jgi:hypothetical protein
MRNDSYSVGQNPRNGKAVVFKGCRKVKEFASEKSAWDFYGLLVRAAAAKKLGEK